MSETQQPVKYLGRVLVVEDDYELADLLAEVLIYENCLVDIASNGMDALDKLRISDYDCIVSDLMMPWVDGRALYQEVSKNQPYLADRFLFVTASASRRAGLSDFIFRTGNILLEKPFEMAEFRSALQEILMRP